ncbi:MAG: MFS transporter [Chloroflexota bacterium]|nr:MFS transporter [Chloroflexota bacterium]
MSRTSRGALALIAIAYLGYVSLGLPDGLLGVAWPSMRATFVQPLDALGPLLASATIGYLASSTAVASLLSRMGIGVLLGVSCAATAAALFFIASAPIWPVVILAGALLGAGGGAIDAGLNTHFATHHGARTMSWLHASYGVGALLGPLVMTTILAASLEWRWGYLLVAGAQVALASAFIASRRGWPRLPLPDERPRVDRRGALRLLPARLGILCFFLYTGIEAGAGQWSFTLMTEGRGEDPVAAGLWISAYYVALTVGRVVYGAVAGRVSDVTALRACMLAGVAASSLVASSLGSAASFAGLALLGLALAPVYPALIAATPRRVGHHHTAATVGSQVGAAVLGAAIFPGLMGVLAERLGLEVIGPSLIALGLSLLLAHEALVRTSPQPLVQPA